jgi:hypothetical protein
MIKNILNGLKISNKFWNNLGIVFIAVSIGFVFVTRILWAGTSIDFSSDQARDLEYIDFLNRNNQLPEYGPPTSRGFKIFPFYYYFIQLISSIFGINPINQIYANSILNFLAFVLVLIICYKIFSFSNFKYLIVGVLSLVYGFNKTFIWQANTMWNPNGLPFFLLLVLLMLFYLSDIKIIKKRYHLISFIIGVLTSIMMGLHGMSFILLPAFLVISVLFIPKIYRGWYSLLTFIGWFISSIPYFLTEIKNNFQNSNNYLEYLFTSDQNFMDFSLWDKILFKLHNGLFSWLNIISTVYLPNTYASFVIFIGIISFIGFFLFQAKTKYIQILLTLVVVYLGIHASLTGLDHVHFMYFAYLLPPVGIANLLIHLDIKKYANKLIIFLLLISALIYCKTNFNLINVYWNNKFGNEYRSITLEDSFDIVKIASKNGIKKLCFNEKTGIETTKPLEYISFSLLSLGVGVTNRCFLEQDKCSHWIIPTNFGYPEIPTILDIEKATNIYHKASFDLYEYCV